MQSRFTIKTALCGLSISIIIPYLIPSTAQEVGDQEQFELELNLTVWVAHVRADKFLLGHLDAEGNFVPDYSKEGLHAWRVGQPFSSITPFTYYNLPKVKPEEPVYEFRSGRLIKGVLKQDGTFVPELGSKVIDLKDYRPGLGARRIYNLPGRLFLKKAVPAAAKP